MDISAIGFNPKSLLGVKGAAAACAVALGVTLVASNSLADANRVVPGVSVDGVPLGGLDFAKARNIIADRAATKLHPITFRYEDQTFQITPDDIHLTPNVDDVADRAFSFGRGSSVPNNLVSQVRSFFAQPDIQIGANYDTDALNANLQQIADKVNRDPVNARCRLAEGNVIEKFPGVIGKKLNVENLAEGLSDKLTTLNLPTAVIELHPEDVEPFITTEDISAIDSILGTYSTYYYPGDRGDNIVLAADAITDKIVKPSWTFSFNDTVGKRTWDRGYKPAGVIINGKPDIDYGGGVCQVSSTLYNAVLLAGLTPTERTPHFFQSTYIGYGRDATVADGQIDFKFRNDLLHNVYLIAEPYGSTLSVFVLGTKADLGGADIAVELDGNSLYRVWYSGNDLLKSEYLHTDIYEKPKPAATSATPA